MLIFHCFVPKPISSDILQYHEENALKMGHNSAKASQAESNSRQDKVKFVDTYIVADAARYIGCRISL
jgi:hypothetical protein